MSAKDNEQTRFLPDFCANQVVFIIVLVAEILAFVLAISAADNLEAFWLGLAYDSLFIQWVTLTSVIILCRLAKYLNQLSIPLQALSVYLVIQLVTLATSWGALWVMHFDQLISISGAWWRPYFFIRNWAVSSICCLVLLRYFYIQHQWQLNMRAEAEARFKALQARIRPHFLFNSMNTIISLIGQRPQQAEQALLDLSDLFRSNLRQQDRIPLAEELELAERYLSIEKLRLGERLRVSWQLINELPMTMPIPALILQPLLENAIYYGIEPRREGGEIAVHVARHKRCLDLVVSNSLPAGNRVLAKERGQGHGIAQENIRQRLMLAYGEEGAMRVAAANDIYQVVLTIPIAPEYQ